ncbi:MULTISPECIES: SDR family NAD(P)-dependent oxidoreductase [unclassified Leisingera]|uniref:SDR family NAD(P)-dependent oxidoreductase n=1 Tax=unclassified Leisingera TaxID=2614906 RepID=UPI0003116EFD|nr:MULTISPECIES: SDR family oxidoreductase [unclassified Leisingera]KIC16497.1 oxidoreductase [Leisingera sp. ANG-DT]KIC24654.1 oxidoreductase [Leisingera sp. ANG-S3]KIC28564.1 oxidoreductase [Leisingera sp. ANG-M6]KIC31691.1 oxidoreductase [Leisingera sp. ANG-S5]KIC55490.1 oxidoreductase [Leisingera sp. ANG-S]
MSFSISGKTAIVTGAASGIGLAIGKQFADAGANVMFADTHEAQLVDELGEQADESNIRYFAGDLRERLTIANLLSATIDAFDDIDILVNGARQVVATDALDPQDETLDQLLNQSLLPSVRLSQQVAKRMIKQGEEREGDGPLGSIINLSSIAARRTHPELMAYSVASAALDQATRSLAVALAPHRIRVNSIAFGSVMSASMQATLKENRSFRQDIEAHTPLGRVASPTELTQTAQYLASDASGFMTGQVLTLDGGRTLLDPVSAPMH